MPPARILAIRLQAFGDTVITLPYLSALRRLLPHATLDFLTREEVSDLPNSLALFDRVFEIGGARRARYQMLSALRLIPALRRRRYDVVIDLQCNHISRVVRKLLHAPAWSEFDRFSPRLAGERTRITIDAVGLGQLDVVPDLALRDPAVGVGVLRGAGWDGASSLVVLNPAGAFPGRNWPLDSYVRFARQWLEHGPARARFVLLGQHHLAQRAAYLREQLGDDVIDLIGRTTAADAFGIVRRASLVVTEDSGLMHVAWVAGTPTIALFGASSATWSRPHGNYSDCIRACVQADGTCIDGVCRAGNPACLETVAAGQVVQRAEALLQQMAGRRKLIDARGHAFAAPVDA